MWTPDSRLLHPPLDVRNGGLGEGQAAGGLTDLALQGLKGRGVGHARDKFLRGDHHLAQFLHGLADRVHAAGHRLDAVLHFLLRRPQRDGLLGLFDGGLGDGHAPRQARDGLARSASAADWAALAALWAVSAAVWAASAAVWAAFAACWAALALVCAPVAVCRAVFAVLCAVWAVLTALSAVPAPSLPRSGLRWLRFGPHWRCLARRWP